MEKVVQPRYFVRRVKEFSFSCLVVDLKGEDPDLKVVTVRDAKKIAEKLNRMERKRKKEGLKRIIEALTGGTK